MDGDDSGEATRIGIREGLDVKDPVGVGDRVGWSKR